MPQRYCRYNKTTNHFASEGACLRFVKDSTPMKHNKAKRKKGRKVCLQMLATGSIRRKKQKSPDLIRSFCHVTNTPQWMTLNPNVKFQVGKRRTESAPASQLWHNTGRSQVWLPVAKEWRPSVLQGSHCSLQFYPWPLHALVTSLPYPLQTQELWDKNHSWWLVLGTPH